MTSGGLQLHRVRMRFGDAAKMLPPCCLLLWYLMFYGWMEVAPGLYELGDDALYVVMIAGILASGYVWRNFRLSRILCIYALFLFVPLTISLIANRSSPILALKYGYAVSRPLIIAGYLIALRVDLLRLHSLVRKMCRVILIVNLPWIVKNLITVNVKLFQSGYNDLIVGVFPFTNSDALTVVYIVLLCSHFYRYFIATGRKVSDVLWTGACLALLLSTVNMKCISITLLGLALLVIVRAGVRGLLFCGVAAIALSSFHGFFPLLMRYLGNLTHVSMFWVLSVMFSGRIEGYSLTVGAGPGMFGSGVAISAHTPLAEKFLVPIQEHFYNMYHTYGTLNRTTSSFSAAVGDTGLVGAALLLGLLAFFAFRLFRLAGTHEIYLTGFMFSIIVIPLGLAMNNWTWGAEVFLMMMAVAQSRREGSGRGDPRYRTSFGGAPSGVSTGSLVPCSG